MKIYNSNVVTLFEKQVSKTPSAPAVWFNNTIFTYQQLNSFANCIANKLLSSKAKSDKLTPLTDELVVVYLDAGFDFASSMWGVLKAGAAYVPIDTSIPTKRVRLIIEETDAKCIITTHELYSKLNINNDMPKALIVDELTDGNINNLSLPIGLDDLAYVMYTSGSTGKPKGVMIEHRGLASSILAKLDYYNEINRNCLLLASVGFDTSISSIYWPLLSGGRLTVPLKNAYQNPDMLVRFIGEQAITHLLCTPSLYQIFLDAIGEEKLESLKLVVVAGEVFRMPLLDRHCDLLPDATLSNEYGPTEASVWSTACRLYDRRTQIKADKVTIGKSAPHAMNAIVEEELLIGGPCLARGYLKRPEENKKRFIKKEVTGYDNIRWYKTGDRCCLSSTGEFSFLGRLDNQIKINGVRVELEEIESIILAYQGIEGAIVRLVEKEGPKKLVAFVCGNVNSKDIQSYLEINLPMAMQPNVIVPMEKFPLNKSGKINESELLKSPEIISRGSDDEVKNSMQEKMAQIWEALLKADNVALDDSFFSLGGHSLLMVQAIIKMNQILKLKITLKQLLENDTIRKLSNSVSVGCDIHLDVAAPSAVKNHVPATRVQKRLWFLQHYHQGESIHYNVPIGFYFKGQLNIPAIEYAINKLVRSNDILRTVFEYGEDGLIQIVQPFSPVAVDLKSINRKNVDTKLTEMARRPFDLTAGPLITFDLFEVEVNNFILLINQHHIIHDGHCTNILFKELKKYYSEYFKQEKVIDSANKLEYSNFAWQEERKENFGQSDDLDFWINHLKEYSVLNLPLDYSRPPHMCYEGEQVGFSLDKHQLEMLKQL